jgi:hypothetical protein
MSAAFRKSAARGNCYERASILGHRLVVFFGGLPVGRMVEHAAMKELHFERAARNGTLMTATEGAIRFQLWEHAGPRVLWGASVFGITGLGMRRKTEDRFFKSRAEAINWLARHRPAETTEGVGGSDLERAAQG